MAARAFFEPIRTLAFGGISGAYANVGAVTTKPVRIFKISNGTAGGMYFSTDGANDVDEMFVAAGSFTLYDLQANKSGKDDKFVLKERTQFSVKQIDAPNSGSVYIECIY